MSTIFLTLHIMILSLTSNSQKENLKTISKNGMTVSWYYEMDKIYFEMIAPTQGWVTIGFNTRADTEGAYLLMGCVTDGKAKVVEHYTISAGNYKPITTLGGNAAVQVIDGIQTSEGTRLKFSVLTKAASQFQRDLDHGISYTIILAYSQEDDFQHHSIMRTSLRITL
jgi:DOMON domain